MLIISHGDNQMKTVIDLMRSYVRVSDLCDAYNKEHGTDVKPWECVKLIIASGSHLQLHAHPTFCENPDIYKFAVAILEGRGVFVGDALYNKFGAYLKVTENCGFLFEHMSWNPPTRTFTLNGVELPCPVVDRLDEDYALDIGRKFVYWFRSREDRDSVLSAINDILREAKNHD